jgi:nucleoside-diphosphate-sugar epimerase
MSAPFWILGAGYTGARVARTLAAAGHEVHVTARDPARLADLAAAGVGVHRLEVLDPDAVARTLGAVAPGARVLDSVPSLERAGAPFDPTPAIVAALGDRPSRLVLISTTGVYGAARFVDEHTAPAPETPRQRVRLEAERAAAAGPWSCLVLRPAAIYGPGRGVHAALRAGRYRLVGAGDNFGSRVHVDDLAALAVAGLSSDLAGAYPAADREPARAREVASFAAALLGLPLPPSVPPEAVDETLRADRRVDARAVFERLGVSLRYPSYREGIPAALAAETP